MRAELFDYRLPAELIAQKPLEKRDASRLMIVDCDNAVIDHSRFRDIESYLGEGDCLVFNSSRVRRARLRGRKKETGGEVELLLLDHRGGGIWEALARPARRLRAGTAIVFGHDELKAEVVEKGQRGCLRFRMTPEDPETVERIVEEIGEIPLPPYIRDELDDPERYQNVFSRHLGSAAAPTAGLHFSHETMLALRGRGLRTAFVRLDVGLDTFRPIHEEEVENHRLHSERVSLDEEACDVINTTRSEGRRVIAVGTTVVRALESSFEDGKVKPGSGYTELFIYPGFEFGVVDCLLTNFHLPRSSLLLLVCAFAGRDLVMEAYREAVERGYRFLSFGDACLFHFARAWKGRE
jgi:S-adenosylmethionine:tRNA ribosyltransferase-isomerase